MLYALSKIQFDDHPPLRFSITKEMDNFLTDHHVIYVLSPMNKACLSQSYDLTLETSQPSDYNLRNQFEDGVA